MQRRIQGKTTRTAGKQKKSIEKARRQSKAMVRSSGGLDSLSFDDKDSGKKSKKSKKKKDKNVQSHRNLSQGSICIRLVIRQLQPTTTAAASTK